MVPVVSIISPTYNHQAYIAECIQSVLDQSFTQWEMIIIDDGSTDNTLSIAREFENRDDRIKVFTQENIGIFRLAETYNRALNMSKGIYIAILEGDDYWDRNKLQLQVDMLNANRDVILSWGQAICMSPDKTAINKINPDTDRIDSNLFNNDPVGSILNMLLYEDRIPALTIMIRKDALVESGGFIQVKGLPTIDLPTLLRLSLVGKFGFVPRILGSWRTYPEQMTKVHPAEIREGYFKLVMNYIEQNNENALIRSLDIEDIRSFHQLQLIIAYSRSGRYKLIRKEFRNARKDYLHSIALPGGEYLWKLRSLTGFIFSLFHMDVEWLARLLNKPAYKIKQG